MNIFCIVALRIYRSILLQFWPLLSLIALTPFKIALPRYKLMCMHRCTGLGLVATL